METLFNVWSLGVFLLIFLVILYFWRKFLDLYLFFVPQEINISGLVVGAYKERYMEPLFFPSKKIVEIAFSYPLCYCIKERHFIKVKTDESDFYLIKVNENLYETLSVAKEIKLECKKYSWNKYLTIKKQKDG
jgi:hypothetical protein